MIYVALLRGINVGGKNKVDMKRLKATFENLGFSSVVTYINSGNVIFEAASKEQTERVNEIEKALEQAFQIAIKVIIRDISSMVTLCQQLPADWIKNEEMRSDVLFLWDKFDKPDILEQIPFNPVDAVIYTPGAVLWNVEGKNYSKSGMKKLLGTELYKNMTIRNVNTVRKLHQLMAAINEQKNDEPFSV